MFLVKFSCPLCGQEHSCEIYLTLIASNEDEMMGKAVQTLNRDDVKVNTLAPFMKEYHQQEEDYLQRATAYARQGVRYLSRAAAKHTTVAKRKCTTEVMGDGSDLGVGWIRGPWGRGPW